MNKMNNKRILSGLGMLAVLAFGVITVPIKASAEGGINYIYGTNIANPPSAYVPAPTTPIVYSNTSNAKPKSVAVAKKTPAKSDNLSANAISGSDSFMPSGILEWILIAILILLMVIIGRKVFGADKKYHAAPMKHA